MRVLTSYCVLTAYSFAKIASNSPTKQSPVLPTRAVPKRSFGTQNEPLSNISNTNLPKKTKHEGYLTGYGILTRSLVEFYTCRFSNNGNTCYINAVLQSVLNQRCFIMDVVKSELHSTNQQSLYLLLHLLIKCKYGRSTHSSHDILVKKIQNLTTSDFTQGKEHVSSLYV